MKKFIPISTFQKRKRCLGFTTLSGTFDTFEKAKEKRRNERDRIFVVILDFIGTQLINMKIAGEFSYEEFPIWRVCRKKFLTYEEAIQLNKKVALLKSANHDPNQLTYIINTNK